MVERKLRPYSVYITEHHYQQLRKAAKSRQAAALVRTAIEMILDGKDQYTAGYNKGLKDAAKAVYDCPEAQMVAVKGKDIGAHLAEQINLLEQ
jgi:hypothetical protein